MLHCFRLVWLATLLLVSASASAHKASDSYLDVRQQDGMLEVVWDVALRDLDLELALDRNQDHQLSWGEVRTRSHDIERHLLARLSLSQGDEPCQLAEPPAALGITRHSDGSYAVLAFRLICTGHDALRIDYRLLAGIDALHRGILTLHHGDQVRTAVLKTGTLQLDAQASLGQTFTSFLREGVHHLLSGYDHLLFLLCLLLPAPLLWRDARWLPSTSGRQTLRATVAVVTAFTVAHSLTLALAALHLVSLPSRWVESAIAASIALTALHVLRPRFTQRRWLLAGGFGLIHGFGFAGVLGELPLGVAERSAALAGFNVGVELGQLGFIGLFLPVLWWMRSYAIYSRFIVSVSAWLIVLVSLLWFVQRAFNLQLIPG